MSKNKFVHVLYFNGLGEGKTHRREKFAMRYLARHNIIIEHASINWHREESFDKLLKRMTTITKQRLKQHGHLVLVGSSAGGSLAVNVLGNIDDKNLYVITLCSRLHMAKLPWWDWRSLARMAYIGKLKESKCFYDSVTYCTKVTIPKLTKAQKRCIVTVQQLADDVVPRATMSIDNVRIYKVSAIGHGWGIALGVRQLPHIVKNLGGDFTRFP